MNRALLGLVAALLIQFPVAVLGDQSKPENTQSEKIEWKMEVTEFGTNYQLERCTIFVSKDDQELYINATDDDYYLGSLKHTIWIKNGMRNESWTVTHYRYGERFLFEGPLVFARYATAAKELPASARKAFQGFYDIE